MSSGCVSQKRRLLGHQQDADSRSERFRGICIYVDTGVPLRADSSHFGNRGCPSRARGGGTGQRRAVGSGLQ